MKTIRTIRTVRTFRKFKISNAQRATYLTKATSNVLTISDRHASRNQASRQLTVLNFVTLGMTTQVQEFLAKASLLVPIHSKIL